MEQFDQHDSQLPAPRTNTPQPSGIDKRKISSKRIAAIIVLVILGTVGGALFLLHSTNQKSTNSSFNQIPQTTIDTWKTYKDAYSQFKYPDDWNTLKELPTYFSSEGIDDYNWNGSHMLASCKDALLILQNPKVSTSLIIIGECLRSSDSSDNETYKRDVIANNSKYTVEIKKWKPGSLNPRTHQEFLWRGDLIEEYQSTYNANPVHELLIIPRYNFMLVHKNGQDSSAELVFDTILSSFTYHKLENMHILSKWQLFKSDLLGFGFEYPMEGQWLDEGIAQPGGEVYLGHEITDEERGKVLKQATLKIYRLYHPSSGILGAGYPKETEVDPENSYDLFKGDPSKPAQITSVAGFDIAGCEKPKDRPLGKAYISFNLPGRKVNGVRLALPLLSDKGKLTTQDCNLNKEENAQDKAARIKKLLEINPQLDKKSNINLLIYQHMLETAKIYSDANLQSYLEK